MTIANSIVYCGKSNRKLLKKRATELCRLKMDDRKKDDQTRIIVGKCRTDFV